ncbi:hypothetical protein GCM10022254_55820 [Actinomadura meridiana]|uniref:Uncharacterized protein n=1 Tax=Actinomadura meridiana TaxID=559626 RepID=A0ABP8CFL2_9ACTN
MPPALGGLHQRGHSRPPPEPGLGGGTSMDEPNAVSYAKRTHVICVAMELLRFLAWIIIVLATR